MRVLDVGGHPGTFAHLLRHSFPAWEVVTVDQLPGSDLTHYVQASGADLPFPDASFDAVISSDTLEHVAPGERASFLAELRRVARRLLVLCAPMAHPATAGIERQLDDAHCRLTGRPHPWLGEHVAYGLPRAEDVVEAWSDLPMRYEPNAPLESWMTWQWLALIHEQSGALDEVWRDASRMAARADAEAASLALPSSVGSRTEPMAPHYRGFFAAWVDVASAPEGLVPGAKMLLPRPCELAAGRCLALSHGLSGLVQSRGLVGGAVASDSPEGLPGALVERLGRALAATENELKRCQTALQSQQREGLLAHLRRAVRSRLWR
jgi:hypothetical protein